MIHHRSSWQFSNMWINMSEMQLWSDANWQIQMYSKTRNVEAEIDHVEKCIASAARSKSNASAIPSQQDQERIEARIIEPPELANSDVVHGVSRGS